MATVGSRGVTRHESPARGHLEISSRSGSNSRYAAQPSAMRTAFVQRPTEYGPAQTTDLCPKDAWDLITEDLEEPARALNA
jgi:hypothetical protein